MNFLLPLLTISKAVKGADMYRITFQQIHYFLTIAKVLNFTEAAKQLYISQPALSKQIHVLESEVGFLLLKRNKRSVALTPEGESLYKDWMIMENMMNSSIYNAKLLRHNAIGRLNIGCTDTFQVDESLSELVENFHSNYPNIEVNMESYGFKTLREQLISNELDIIFIPYFELENFKNVDWMNFIDVNLCIAISTSNPLSKQSHVTIKDLKNEPFVTITPKESALGVEKVRNQCRQNGFEPTIVKYVSNLNSLTLAVKQGVGVTICHNLISDKKIKIFELEEQPKDSNIIAIWKSDADSVELDLFKSELYNIVEKD